MTNQINTEIEDELSELVKEIDSLVKAKAVHSSHLHETDAAKSSEPGMRWCPGCRLKVVSARLAEMTSARDDDKVPAHKLAEGGKSRRDEVMAHLKERRELEKP